MTTTPPNNASTPPLDDQRTPAEPRLELEGGIEYQRMRGEIASSLFGESAQPLRIGRFTVLDRLGAGGMGVVYAAYDDVLDRKVAVKVLHGQASERGRQQILREARAMARLTHPNIVAVHEVGEHDDQVFVAMEFVRGKSLDRWIHDRDKPHPWRTVVEVFRKAGRGLAAAHQAGLVHRDFKPHNAILADDGAVKVLDFGLAFPSDREPGPTTTGEGENDDDDDDEPTEASVPLTRSLTRTGAMVGTPAYMAPEQLRAEPATAATDQFAFAVSLFEALHGQRPFAGNRLEHLVASVLDGVIEEPPNAAAVPSWIRAICRRGLSLDPDARFESVGAMLDALDRDPASARRRWLGGAAVLALAVGGSFGLAALQQRAEETPCTDLQKVLADTWNDDRAQVVREGFLASGVSHAADTWGRVEPQLQQFASTWVDASTDACLAHHDGRQSEAIFDLRTVCLESGRASFVAALELLEGADEAVAHSAAKLTAGLPSLSRCGDLQQLTAALPPPEDPDDAAEVASVREQLALAEVNYNAGHYDAATELARDAHTRALAVDHAPVLAEAAFRLGAIFQELRQPADSEHALDEAFYTAVAVGHDQIAVEALAHRVFVRGDLQGQPQRALYDDPLARALLSRMPNRPRLSWLLANNLAVVHDLAGQTEQSITLFQEALEHARARGDEGTLNTSAVLANLALLHHDQEQPVEAVRYGREALTLAERSLGPEHPQIPLYLYALANPQIDLGQLRQGQALLERSVAFYDDVEAPSPDVAQDLFMLAQIALTYRDYEEAHAHAIRGLAIVERHPGEQDRAASLLHALGDAQFGLGDVEQGKDSHAQALGLATQPLPEQTDEAEADGVVARPWLASSLRAIAYAYERLGGSDPIERALGYVTDAVAHERALRQEGSPQLVPVLLHLARVQRLAGDLQGARKSLDEVLALVDAEAPNAIALARIQLERGDFLSAAERWPQAQTQYAAAIATMQRSFDADHPDLARARLSLARALRHCAPADADCATRGRSLAQSAADTYKALGPRFAPEAAEAAAWRPTAIEG